jgi:hypothetical protein
MNWDAYRILADLVFKPTNSISINLSDFITYNGSFSLLHVSIHVLDHLQVVNNKQASCY